MDHFTGLPLELTFTILKCLPIRDLLVCLQVNKTLNEAGEQVLYRDIELIWRRKQREALRPVQQSSFRKLSDLVFRTLQQPSRSTYVQHLRINLGYLESLWGPAGTNAMTEADNELLKKAADLATKSLPEKEELLANLMAGIPNAYIGLLLFQTQNIKSLSIGHPGGNSRAADLNSSTTGTSCIPVSNIPFPTLEAFSYMTLTDQSHTDTIPTKVEARHFIPFFNTPRVRSISLYLFTNQEIFTKVPQASSTLTQLVLHKFLLGIDQLENLLLATPNLRVLSLDYWVNCEDTTAAKPHLDVPQLFRGLYPVRKSLRKFKLTTRFFCKNGVYFGIIDDGGDFFDSTTS